MTTPNELEKRLVSAISNTDGSWTLSGESLLSEKDEPSVTPSRILWNSSNDSSNFTLSLEIRSTIPSSAAERRSKLLRFMAVLELALSFPISISESARNDSSKQTSSVVSAEERIAELELRNAALEAQIHATGYEPVDGPDLRSDSSGDGSGDYL